VLVFGLLLAAIPFVLPIASWVASRRTRARVEELSGTIRDQQVTIDRLSTLVGELRREPRTSHGAARPADLAAADPVATGAVSQPPTSPVAPPSPVTRVPVVPPSPSSVAPTAPRENPWPELAHVRPAPASPPASPAAPPVTPKEDPWPERARERERAQQPPAPTRPVASPPVSEPRPPTAATPVTPPLVPPSLPPPPRRPTSAPPPPSAFDLESLVGVKLFSAIAGIALVLAAVFFLKYSVEHGWLQPPIRVLIGTAVGVSLLVVCELKAARRYPVTANALDAAAIAVLFSTFFAAHALWNLIPSLAAFVLLAMVTAVAVLLSIRRESLFIAVLGLLGGFATPALLSTGENRPIPLFAYLMLLNIGLAWVAYRQVWPLLTALTVLFTAIYQWIWVLKFLDAASLPLGMGIFAVFPLAALAGLAIARGRVLSKESGAGADSAFEYTALGAAIMPLLFVVYLSGVPAYGSRPWLLLGFLLLVDAGLFVVAVARRRSLLHLAGAWATLVVMASWLGFSYTNGAYLPPLVFCSLFVAFYAGAPVASRFLGFDSIGGPADFAAPLLLFVPAVLARMEPAFADPRLLFALVFVLVLIIAWRAISDRRGELYFIAAFFTVATQAVWSSTYLDVDRLGPAVAIYGVFGLLATVIPLAARSIGRPLEPRAGGGLVLIASLGLLLFLSLGTVSPAALWALALLLAILNAGLFIESGSGGLPFVSVVGSLLSWIVLASWWMRAGAAVGVVPSLAVLTGLTLVTFAGHAWVNRWTEKTTASAVGVGEGLYLGLVGHLFVLAISTNPAWSIPPGPLFGTLAVLTLTSSTVSLVTRRSVLHVVGAAAAGTVVAAWTYAAGPSWALVGLVASAAASLFALLWMPIDKDGLVRQGAAALLFLGEVTAIIAARSGAGVIWFGFVIAAHVSNLALLLSLTSIERWRRVTIGAVFAGCYAVAVQWATDALTVGWLQLLLLSFAIYAVFIAYPLVLGRRAQGDREPSIAAVLASFMFLFAARAALMAGGYGWIVGALPVAEGAVMALLLRQLLRMERPGARDIGRLALVAGTALAFVTVAIPLQLHRQWITIGWALEGAALAWLFKRIRHRGLHYWSLGLFGAVFVRLAMNPEILLYEPRGQMRILNWYLYAYLVCAAAFLLAAWWLYPSGRDDSSAERNSSSLLSAGAVILLFLLLNIEIADFYATGPTIMFRFGATVSQDLTYTIGWLGFGMALLAACIYLHSRVGRVASLALIAFTTFKCFLYDLSSLEGLYRVGSFVGLAMSLALVSVALQKFVLAKPEEQT
jgi:uncharacterized membrane protein